MTLLREALRGQPISRRDLFQQAGVAGLGLAGAALLGCEGKKPEDLAQTLLTERINPNKLPDGIIYLETSTSDLDYIAKFFGAIKVVVIQTADRSTPTNQNSGIGYIIFKDREGPKYYLADVKNKAAASVRNIKADNLPSSSITLNGAIFDAQSFQLCMASIDNVVITGIHTSDAATAIQLARSGISHLKKVK